MPLPLETGDTNKGEFGNVEVIKGQTCDQTSKKGTVNCSSKFKKHTITVGPNDKIRIRGTFTNFDPIVEGEACNSTDEVDDNFLNSGGSTFIISVNNGGVGALCCLQIPTRVSGSPWSGPSPRIIPTWRFRSAVLRPGRIATTIPGRPLRTAR